jgi:hypothetical protein
VPQVTSDDIERVIRREFPLDQLVDVMPLQLARGSAKRPYPLIEDGRRDFRDVVDWANISQPLQEGISGSPDAAT